MLMRNTMESWHYSKKTGMPAKDSVFEIFLNFVLRLAYKIVKTVSSVAQRIFPTGIDGKTTIKE